MDKKINKEPSKDNQAFGSFERIKDKRRKKLRKDNEKRLRKKTTDNDYD